MAGVDGSVQGATREQFIAKRDEYNKQASEAWHGRDNGLRSVILRAIDKRLAEMTCGTD